MPMLERRGRAATKADPEPNSLSVCQSPPLRRSSRGSGSSGFLERLLASRRRSLNTSPTAFDAKGALGLNLLYSPSEPLVEFVFVHGLGGGSTKTWCFTEDPSLFWPKAWLPREPAFRNVRFHSFGYDADWMSTRDAPTLNIHDFGQSLLENLRVSPYIRSAETNPIVFIAHSMGGLVIKQAYVLARLDPSCSDLVKRIEAMVFLATPHRGSDLAATLNSILRASVAHNSRAYISDLDRPSEMLAMLNDSFRHCAHDLTLYSFYESQETNLRIRSELIVPRESAVMGLPGERATLLNADHRHVCKFEAPSDSSYLAIRNALQTINDAIMKRLSSLIAQKSWREMQQIDNYLALPGKPDDDLRDLEEARVEGSCEWFAGKESFQKWVDSELDDTPNIYLVCAKPAAGKSVLSGYIINTLASLSLDCMYYFFRHGNKEKSTVSGLLRSIVFQMAATSVNVRQKLLSMIDKGVRFDKDDAKAVWRKLVSPIISRFDSSQTQYWVLDAFDECSDFDILFPMIFSIDSTAPVRILITSRETPEIIDQLDSFQTNPSRHSAVCEEISFVDTKTDIALYLNANRAKLHVGGDAEKDLFINRIIEKSDGCFLWVRLVLDELASAWTVSQVEQILQEVPQNMDSLYNRALSIMSSKPKAAKSIARAILTWTVCAIRPLILSELQTALKIDLEDDVRELESAIASLCAHLVYVDKNGRVLIVHLTARTFLVDPMLKSEFSVNEKSSHLRLAQICLQYLNSDEMRPPRGRRFKRMQNRKPGRSQFVAYACTAFAEHMSQATSRTGAISKLLYDFLQNNVMSWIEVVATTGNLSILTRTANSVKAYLLRHIQSASPLGEFVQIVEGWVVDLHRIVAKFGVTLMSSPSAIHWLIPPFCPPSSCIAKCYKSTSKGIVVTGLRDTGWDDRLSCIDSHGSQVSSVACGEAFFAVGHSAGHIMLHHNITCLEWRSLDHGEPVRHLRFDTTGSLLVSSGRRDLKVWDIETGFMLRTFTVSNDILGFTFFDKEKVLVAATRGDSTQSWTLQSGREAGRTAWAESLPFYTEGKFHRPPLIAAFCPDESLIAIVYRGRSICLYNMEADELHGLVGREEDPSSLVLGTNTSPASLAFNTNEAMPLLAAAYEDGDLCLFDYEDLKLLKMIEGNAQTVACSPDGLTLATGNAAGMVQLLEFETLQLLYRVNAADYGIRYLAFSADNLRLLDVRGSQCNVWEPPVLGGLSKRDEMSTEPSSFDPVIRGIPDGEVEITRMKLEPHGENFFTGKSDGTVCVHDSQSGAQRRVLYRHTYQIPVTSMDWGSRKSIILTGDAASRFIICSLKRDKETGWIVATKIMDKHADSKILDVLLDPTNELVLISTSESNTIWHIGDKIQLSRGMSTSTPSFALMNHPLNDQCRLLVMPDAVTVLDWRSADTVLARCALQFPDQLPISPTQGVKNAFIFANNRLLVVEISELYGQQSTTQIMVYTIESLDPDTASFVPLHNYHAVEQQVVHTIGTYASRLIFFNKSHWVCSVDYDQLEQGRYIRHFPIPSDWQSQQRTLRMGISSKLDIFFVRIDEVAIITRGLDFEEQVTLDHV